MRSAVFLSLGMALGLVLAVLIPTPAKTPAVEWLQNPRPVATFRLQQSGGEYTHMDLRGGWHLLAFGYTHCPDICPTSLGELRQLHLAMEAVPLQVVFVSVDPTRDSPDGLADYVQYFHPAFTAVTGDEANLAALTGSLGIQFKVPAEGGAIAHSIGFSLVGPDGQLRGRLRPGFDTNVAAREISAGMGAMNAAVKVAES